MVSDPLNAHGRAACAPHALSISFDPFTVVAGETFTASWSSNGAATCSETGGLPNDAGDESPDGAPTGSVTELASAGQFTFGLTCQSVDPALPPVTTQANLTIATLSDSLTSSATSVTNGASFTLTWSSTGASSCTVSGGGANGIPWSGPQATSGSLTQKATTNGSFTYDLECGINNVVTDEAVIIHVAAPGSGSSASSGGGVAGARGPGSGTCAAEAAHPPAPPRAPAGTLRRRPGRARGPKVPRLA